MRTKNNTCCFTGHRDTSNVTYQQLLDRLEPLAMSLISNGYRYFICGGALGFDTFAATYVLSLKKRGFPVKLVMMLPCYNQGAKWDENDRYVLNYHIQNADEIIYVSKSDYFVGCMQKRNRALVDASSACICYLCKYGNSGTKQTVEYARANGLAIINVATP